MRHSSKEEMLGAADQNYCINVQAILISVKAMEGQMAGRCDREKGKKLYNRSVLS